MQEAEIYSALTDVFRDVFEDDTIVLKPESKPSDFAGWDSARYVTLVVASEGRFRVKFRPVDLEALRTIGDFVKRIGEIRR